MINKFKILTKRQAGDTIIEVLFCVAVISGTLLATYKSIDHAYVTFQVNQERNWAVKLVESQTDELYVYAKKNPGFTFNFNCFSYDGAGNISTATNGGSPNKCIVGANGLTASASTVPAYTISIIQSPLSNQTYIASASWVGPEGNQTTSMWYRPPR